MSLYSVQNSAILNFRTRWATACPRSRKQMVMVDATPGQGGRNAAHIGTDLGIDSVDPLDPAFAVMNFVQGLSLSCLDHGVSTRSDMTFPVRCE